MKIRLTLTIIVCGLLCVFPVDIKGQRCRCTLQRGGDCRSCTVGCYLSSEGWCGKCHSHCNSCSQYYDCTTCIAGRTGFHCQECKDGYYDNNGQCVQCNTNCLQGKCDVNSGECDDGCQDGWSGSRCNDACAPTCASCQRYNKSTCNSCPFNYYGMSCESECSSNCVAIDSARQCSDTNGDCNNGCVDGWTELKCTDECDMHCISCDAEDKAICHNCSPGFYGQSCENKCSSNCVQKIDKRQCSKSDGQCTDGCLEGWTGATCTEQCAAKCTSCYRQNGIECTSCKPDYYGPSCNIECSKYCAGTQGAKKSDKVDVIGGVVGSAVMIVLVVAAVLVFIFHRKRRRIMSDPEKRVTYDISVNIEVPGRKRSDYGNVDKTQSTARSTLHKLTPSKGPVTNGVVIYGNMGGLPVIPSGLSVDDPEDNVEELCEDEVKSGNLKDADTPNAENYYNIYGLTKSRVQVDTLREHVLSISTEEFEKEFKKLPKGLTRPYGEAVKPTNVSKNRYKGILPYDSNRVKLTGNGGDYINASYIQGFEKSEKTYIASSGPVEKFMNGYVDFWEMIWQEKVDKIVMLTNFMEESKMKCEKYWPDFGEHNTYGDINVHSMSDEKYADFTVTKITMKKDSQVFIIHHFHFTAWPYRGSPENVVSLVEFRESVEHVPKITEGPIVVHCSAGVGRTGTYIALDILTQAGRSENFLDVYGCVLGLRGQRVIMVQNVEQYRFLHYALSHSLTNKCDQIASKDFCTVNTDELHEQFQLLGTVNVLNGDEEKKASKKNGKEKYKNRKGACIPGDAHRPRLLKCNQNSKSDYINAIYIDGYMEKNRYIVAQTPLSRTVEDFLGLVLQENCSCIISLDPVEITSKQDIGDYLPDVNQELSVGKVKVNCVQREITPEYILSKLNVCVQEVILHCDASKMCKQAENVKSDDESLNIKTFQSTDEPKTFLHYQYTDWPEESPVPSSTRSFLNLVLESRRTTRKPNMQLEPVLIHCLAGGDRSGLFAVVANILEKINSEQQASIVNVVSQVRARRPLAIPNMEQFKYCYELASLFIENNSL